MDDKVFTPEVVEDNSFPIQGAVVVDNQNQGGTGGNFSPAVTKDRPLPKKRTAVELLSTALNTRSKKVLQEFELTSSGGFKIGNFQDGISGDIRLTPNGISARDKSGIDTFVLDGDTGDALFKGTVRAGSFVSGSKNGVTVGPEAGVDGADFDDIQVALDYVNDLGGGVVLIKKGTYVVNSNLSLYSNIVLLGEDNDTTILDFNSKSRHLHAIGTYTDNLNNIHIENLQFINSTDTNVGTVYFKYVNDFSVNRCKFFNNYNSNDGFGFDIVITLSSRGIVENCYSYRSDRLVYVNTDTISMKIVNNHVRECYTGAITVSSCRDVFIAGNTIDTAGPTFFNGVDGINIDASNNCRVVDNFLYNCVSNSIEVGATGDCYSITVANNNIIGATITNSKGIVVRNNSLLCTINNNVITNAGTGSVGIHMDDGDGNTIIGNIIESPATSILIDATCDKTIVVGNRHFSTFTDNGTNTSTNNNVA